MAKYDVSFKVGADGANDVLEQLEKIQKYIDSINGAKTTVKINPKVDTSGVDSLNTKLKGAQREAYTLSDALAGVGSAFSTAGGALQSIGSFFGADTIGTVTKTLTSYATVMATAGFGKSIDRYDTMATFPKMMSAMGYDADNAAEAVNTLNEAVLGLPTSLSDIVEQAQNFTAITGDLEKGVEYAIAVNNAFLAGGADTSQVYYGTKQLQDLMSAGELQSMEWQSLIKAMGPSWREIGKEMGYAEDELTDFRTALTGGEIDGQEFLEAMVRAATGTGQLAQMAGLSKEKISSALSNVQTAFASTGQAIIETVNELFEEFEGQSLADKIVGAGAWVKTELKPVMVDWVTENFDDLQTFIDRIAGYDWTGLLDKVADATATLFDLYTGIASKMPTSVVAGGMVLASPIGKIVSAIGSLITGISGLNLTKLITFGKKAPAAGDAVASVGSFIGSLKTAGLALLGTAGAVGVAGELGLVIKEYIGVIQSISDMNIGGNYSRNISAVAKFMAVSGTITGGIVGLMSVFTNVGMGGYIAAGELLSAGLVGVIGLTGGVIGAYVDVIDKIGGLSLNSTTLEKNMKTIATATTEINLLMAGNGLITLFTGLTELMAAGVLAVDVAVIDKIIDVVVKLSEMDSVDIDVTGLQENIRDLREIIVTLTDDEGLWSALVKADITNSMSKAAENMTSIMSSWRDIVSAYAEDTTEVDTAAINARITEDASNIGKAIDALTGETNPFTALMDAMSSGSMDTALTNIQSMVSTWNAIQESFGGATTAVTNGTGTSFEAPGGTFSKENPIVTKINEIVSSVSDISDAMSGGSDVFHKAGSVVAKALDASSATSLVSIIGSIQTLITDFGTLQTTVKSVTIDDSVSGAITSMFTSLDAMFAGIPAPDYNELVTRLSSWSMLLDADHMLGVATKIMALGNLIAEDGYSALNNLQTFFGTRMATFSTSLADIDTDDFDERVQNIQHMFDRLNILLSVIKAVEFEEAMEKVQQMRDAMNEQVVGLLTSLMSVQAYLSQLGADSEEIPVVMMLSNLFSGLDSSMSGDGFEGFNENLVLLAENLDGITLSLGELFTVLESSTELVEAYNYAIGENLQPNIQFIVEALAGIPMQLATLNDMLIIFMTSGIEPLALDVETLRQDVDDLSYSLEIELVAAMVATVSQMSITQTATESFTSAVVKLKAAIDNLRSSLVKLQSELKKTQTQMTQATQRARELAAAINAIPDHKTVTIDIQTNGEVPSYAATGGMISNRGVLYRANGGWTPRGTDTVPAMLTPGEFVMNTKAVKALGPTFFRSINRGDIKGAMARVASRYFGSASYNVNNSRTYNNNAQVTQNIYTNNEQFTYRRARRFVEAL